MFRTFWEKFYPNATRNDIRVYEPHRSVFAVPNQALPRNMRSLFLASERYTMKYPLLKRSRIYNFRSLSHDKKWSQFFLIGIFVFLSVVLLITITILIVFLIQISTEKTINITTEQYFSEKNPHIDQKITNLYPSHSGSYLKVENRKHDDRTPCYDTCWPYTAFRFKSRCQNGYCYCKGNGYNNLTCLPVFGNCVISKNSSNAVAFFQGKSQNTFSCYTSRSSQPTNQDQVYIISVMNEKPSHHPLTVNITLSNLSQVIHWPVKLVFASYYPVHWLLTTDSRLKLKSVIQVSTVHAHQGHLTVNGKNLTEDREKYIRHRSLVGYGDDRDSGHTLHLLETVQRISGNFTSFSGAKQADRWLMIIHPELTMKNFKQRLNFHTTNNSSKNVTEDDYQS